VVKDMAHHLREVPTHKELKLWIRVPKTKIDIKKENPVNGIFSNWSREQQLIFLAGVFEGEGTITMIPQKNTNKSSLSCRVKMTDRDIIQRFVDFVGHGNIYSEKKRESENKLSFCWKVSGPRAINFLHEIAPYLGVRRYNRVIQCLALYKQERNL
jgi:hypothetical protein